MFKANTEKLWKGLLLIAILLVSIPAFAAPIKVTGRVQDVNGDPLIGVSVKEKGTNNVTVTDVNGIYNIACSSDKAILVAEYIGFQSEERKVTGTLIDFVLKDEVSKLDEVTVVGYTTARKVSVLGAQSSLKMDHVKAPVANMSSILAGRVSGVVSVQRTGLPGQDDSDIWVRGISTLTNRNEGPLILVDGIERSFNNLDPEDIQSVTVLKDAASTAVYGVRGGNGVIIITTKPGVVSKPKFSVDVYQGITQLTKVPDLADGIEYMNAVNEAYNNSYGKAYYSQQYITNTKVANGLPTPELTSEQRAELESQRSINKYLYPNVDWMRELYHKYGWNRRVNLNIRGGAPNANYYISLSYYQEKGLTKTDPTQDYSTEIDYNRYNFLTNVNLKATKMTNIDVGVSGYFASGNYPNRSLNDIYTRAMNTNPVIYPVQYPNGENPGYSQVQRELDNPWVELTRRGYQTQYNTQVNSNLKITQDLGFWDWSKGLTARALVAFDVRATQTLSYSVDNSTWKPSGSKDPTTGDTWLDDGNLYDENGNIKLQEEFKGNTTMSFKSDKWVYRTFYFEAALDYKHTFAKRHNVSGLVVFNIRNYRDANGDLIGSLPHKQESLSARATYDYDNRYFVEANLGYTGSENFAKGHRFGTFPAWAIGWVPSNEGWWKPVSHVISFLKLRYSDGTVGNDSQNGRFGYFTEITGKSGYSSYWGTDGIGYNKYGFQAQWSKIRKQDLGIEINFLHDDLTFVFDLFKERRTKIFVDRNNLPLLAGFAATASANVGIVKNKGYEIALEYSHQFGKDLFVSVRGNITENTDKVVENAEAEPAYPWLERRGHNVLARWGYIAEGLYTSTEQITQRGITQFGETHPGELVKPGDIMYKDLNGDKHIDENDMTCIGRGDIPRIYYGFGGDIRYKNIGVGVLFQGVADADRELQGNGIRPFRSSTGGGTLYSNITDRWNSNNPTKTDVFYPRLAWGEKDASNTNNFVTSTWWQRDVSFMRLKQFTISYYFPKAWERNGILKGGRFYIMGENVFTFSKFKLWDPELNTDNGISYPNVRTFSVGVNFNI
ncbi:TonB-linked outer membrane protein, SusC/RagA family [Hoylesella oralis ATCC 33269]|uniref:TonB-linked outer membrane protein, SusC/RagA family n=1 Tax=Hoylesella oralis ATCC 33269 TaxID=873533 RepID=E7RQN3_9BACT|nr:TonB-dependent receptor [Hoylesella oralis]EFZ36571.1 TonB-linked outer membrane protein, SusC/RagA family [Hoylesella oralis ATCC 33269]EPH17963.1 SusC/RagA family TonB-linked outer membrane protein [Hoylesella oralis HGA0225]SHF98305.1 TonB-linked outer membrane protein, SusC/RagA family [Hoylesella oralis]